VLVESLARSLACTHPMPTRLSHAFLIVSEYLVDHVPGSRGFINTNAGANIVSKTFFLFL
jgi:hypothetical protein